MRQPKQSVDSNSRALMIFRARPETSVNPEAVSGSVMSTFKRERNPDAVDHSAISTSELADSAPSPRRTPRVSLIVVLPEHHVVSPNRLTESLRGPLDQQVDVLVACAGQPMNLSALQRSVGNAQFLLAPAGTSTEDLRQLAIQQAPGDIV